MGEAGNPEVRDDTKAIPADAVAPLVNCRLVSRILLTVESPSFE